MTTRDPNLVSITLGSTGCAAMVSLGPAGRPRDCRGEPTHAGFSRVQRPRFRLFVCDLHQDAVDDAAPMTDEDRAELDGRIVQTERALAGLNYDRVGPIEEDQEDRL